MGIDSIVFYLVLGVWVSMVVAGASRDAKMYATVGLALAALGLFF